MVTPAGGRASRAGSRPPGRALRPTGCSWVPRARSGVDHRSLGAGPAPATLARRWPGRASPRFAAGAAAVRALAQSGLAPSNCRLIDPVEALVNGAGDGSAAVLIVGFESADHPVDAWAGRAARCVRDHGGGDRRRRVEDARRPWQGTDAPGGDRRSGRPTPGGGRSCERPYVRDALVTLGAMVETFETAVTWDRFDVLPTPVTAAVRGALGDQGTGAGFVTCRLTHAYPDGAAPYFTVIAPATAGWRARAVGRGQGRRRRRPHRRRAGTITHHHAVGRDHRPWYDRQRPALFADALRAAKAVGRPGRDLQPRCARRRPPRGVGPRPSLGAWPIEPSKGSKLSVLDTVLVSRGRGRRHPGCACGSSGPWWAWPCSPSRSSCWWSWWP